MKTFIAFTALSIALVNISFANDEIFEQIGQDGQTSYSKTEIATVAGDLEAKAIKGKIAIITFAPSKAPTYMEIEEIVASLEKEFNIKLSYAFGEFKGTDKGVVISVNADSGYTVISENSLLELEAQAVES